MRTPVRSTGGELLARFHARENGRLVSGAEAFAAMWRAIPLLRPFGLLFRGPFALAVLEGFCRADTAGSTAMAEAIRRGLDDAGIAVRALAPDPQP